MRTSLLKIAGIFLCMFFCLKISYADSVKKIDESFMAGKDIPLAQAKNWSAINSAQSAFFLGHALMNNGVIVFIKPSELGAASHLVRRSLAGQAHLTDVIIDQGYLAALITIMNLQQDTERVQQLRNWQKNNQSPTLTVLVISNDANVLSIPLVTNMNTLNQYHVRSLIPRNG